MLNGELTVLALMGTSKKCYERFESKADGAQKPECTHRVHEDFEHRPTQQSKRAISFYRCPYTCTRRLQGGKAKKIFAGSVINA